MNQFDSLIKEKEEELARLKTQKAEYNKLKPEWKIADILHSRMCRLNHIDQCGWDYASWQKPDGTREEYLKKALAILRQVEFDKALAIVNIL